MDNKLYRDGDIVRYEYIGDQTYDKVAATTPFTIAMCEEVRQEGKSVRLLIDVSQVGHQDTGARKATLEALNILVFDKMALFGASPFIKYVAEFVIRASGKQDKVKYFRTQEEALAWLQS